MIKNTSRNLFRKNRELRKAEITRSQSNVFLTSLCFLLFCLFLMLNHSLAFGVTALSVGFSITIAVFCLFFGTNPIEQTKIFCEELIEGYKNTITRLR